MKIILIFILAVIVSSCSMGNKTHSGNTLTNGQFDSVLVDKDGNRYSVKKLNDGRLWMTANLKINIPTSYCYGDSEKYCEQYGRLYSWEAAQKGCTLLGEGWILPTADEWQRLVASYSGSATDSMEARKTAYQALSFTGKSQFNALLAGGRNPDDQYARIKAHGFYWTATEHDGSTAWFANFAKGSKALFIQPEGEKLRAFSVRCIKAIDVMQDEERR